MGSNSNFYRIMYSFFNPPVSDFEVTSDEVLTVPDQSLSVRDILHRFTRGQMDVPPIEQGDDDDIYSDDSFDDLSDAFGSVSSGVELLDEMQAQASKRQDISTPQETSEASSGNSSTESSADVP